LLLKLDSQTHMKIQATIRSIVIILAILASACKPYYKAFYTDPEKCFAEASTSDPYDVIIVPGFPSDSGKINQTLADRIIWAHYLYKNGYAKNIIFSGAAVHTPYVESEVMHQYALQLGIPEENIFIERAALHTTENMYYGHQKAQELGYTKIAFATHPAQSSFMKPFRRKFKLKLDFMPILSDSIANLNPEFKSIDLAKAYQSNFVPLKEKEGVLKRLQGTRGRQVKKEIKIAERID